MNCSMHECKTALLRMGMYLRPGLGCCTNDTIEAVLIQPHGPAGLTGAELSCRIKDRHPAASKGGAAHSHDSLQSIYSIVSLPSSGCNGHTCLCSTFCMILACCHYCVSAGQSHKDCKPVSPCPPCVASPHRKKIAWVRNFQLERHLCSHMLPAEPVSLNPSQER